MSVHSRVVDIASVVVICAAPASRSSRSARSTPVRAPAPGRTPLMADLEQGAEDEHKEGAMGKMKLC